MIWDNRPRTRCGLASIKSCVPMLTTVQPMALAELRPRVWFSFLSHGLRSFLVLIALSSIVPGTAMLINLQSSTPSRTRLNNSFDVGSNGKKFLRKGSS
uniref:Uncharacterized protein n=1 Tax=Arundo donax TaxID=35708 RepID=A0A0A9G0S6_ARUDO